MGSVKKKVLSGSDYTNEEREGGDHIDLV